MGQAFHYTDSCGYKGIRAQQAWNFVASKPPARDRPVGAYFTTICPSEQNLSLICKKLRIPRTKRQYVLGLRDSEKLTQLNGGRGRDQYILYSAKDYVVKKKRQLCHGLADDCKEMFK